MFLSVDGDSDGAAVAHDDARGVVDHGVLLHDLRRAIRFLDLCIYIYILHTQTYAHEHNGTQHNIKKNT